MAIMQCTLFQNTCLSNIRINLILPDTTVIWLHLRRWLYGSIFCDCMDLSSFKFSWWAPKERAWHYSVYTNALIRCMATGQRTPMWHYVGWGIIFGLLLWQWMMSSSSQAWEQVFIEHFLFRPIVSKTCWDIDNKTFTYTGCTNKEELCNVLIAALIKCILVIIGSHNRKMCETNKYQFITTTACNLPQRGVIST